MEARSIRAVLMAALLTVCMGARFRTPNFIIETPQEQLARQFGRTAEKLRRDLAAEWLGRAMPNWSQPCVMTVHVGPRLGAGGATSFVFDRGEVFGWRMTIQGPRERILDSVLPHEITHMVLASHFRRPVPRWADEGAASGAEIPSERTKHRRMLIRFLQTGRGIAFDRMFAMKQYPRDIMPLYAQGFSLADYLIQLGGKRKFLAFLGDGMSTEQWAAALKCHYGIGGVLSLQDTWLAWVRRGSPALRTRQGHPAAVADATAVAAGGRLPRPEPNLIYHIRDRQSRSYAPGSVIAAEQAGDFSAERPGPQRSPPAAKQLPASGWHATGERPRPVVSAPTPRPSPPQVVPRQAPLMMAGSCTSGG